ncbi:acetyl-CoA carboxylase biotin carboxylase subunit [Oceanobacillus halotolerans]|uniref:acetyl-CoA carboxylase biotin carboxylase subunit n=1 Tax=Oceanobacillus halotolerans TaxID=2663380 RepID=UPI0013DC8742|nr:acetyl-CoA carboxylase biotin carboxylase subunit [Oceanobacillus halotolerans]
MIKKILIANRGEIAARVIRTCKQLGITTVAVYSEADQKAPYVNMADEKHLLGGPRVQESYLNIDKIISIARKTNVDAIHPGYGFLSESSIFVEKCEEASITFIGPPKKAIEQMGSKIKARNLMQQAGVPVIPGTEEAINNIDEAINIAQSIGYPIMLKASHGGGGIGMQVVQNEQDLVKSFESNAKRAQAFFGNGAMFMEKKIENARHIEIQLLADHFGNVIHLFERDCSIQRRNQKVIEEAPCPCLSQETRTKMGEAAITAAKSLGYTNAGTVEFLVDEKENFYFLEMNTRIQVEHPITEEITGIDIVEKQIEIADRKVLTIKQEDLNISGYAMEARIYAEDPKTFLPSPGHIHTFSIPKEDYIRHELGVTENYDVTPFYDPMIGKLIVKGESRELVVNRLKEALLHYKVEGIKTNIPMLLKTLDHEAFRKGNITTTFVENQLNK